MLSETDRKKKIDILTELIWKNWQILFYELDKTGKLISWPAFVGESEKILTKGLREAVKKKNAANTLPFIYIENDNVYYWSFCYHNRKYILGPMCERELSFHAKKRYFHDRKIGNFDFPLAERTIEKSFPVISMVYFHLTGNAFDEEDFSRIPEGEWIRLGEQMMLERVDRQKEERVHSSYKSERQWYQAIKNGQVGFRYSRPMIEEVGLMAKENIVKQREYLLVSKITLATRAAIEGGVAPAKAYALSDMLLQRCSKSEALEDWMRLNYQVTDGFAKLVKREIAEKKMDPDVERCKDYIAGHITKKISLAQMAEELGTSYSNLSNKFRRYEGKGIKKYVQEEKLKAAANLLKYSQYGVGDISDYLSFPSASSMCQFFRAYYGITPMEYRKRNQIADFNFE